MSLFNSRTGMKACPTMIKDLFWLSIPVLGVLLVFEACKILCGVFL